MNAPTPGKEHTDLTAWDMILHGKIPKYDVPCEGLIWTKAAPAPWAVLPAPVRIWPENVPDAYLYKRW
jgi:hypothetical protein